MSAIETAARLIISAQRNRTPIAVPPFALASVEEAYAVQSLVAEALGPLAGWKVGKTAEGIFVRAPLYESGSFQSPANLERVSFHHFLVESELAVRLAEPLAPRPEPYTTIEVIAAIGTLHAAIETVDSCFKEWPKVDPLWSLAGGLSHGSFILGSGRPAGNLQDLQRATYELQLNGVTVKEGQADHPAGDPLAMLVWLANDLSHSGHGLKSGDIITTGTFTGATEVVPGQQVWVQFNNIGEAVLHLA